VVSLGLILGDAPASVRPRDNLDLMLAQVEEGQRAGFTHFVVGQHYIYGDVRWLQPLPLLARLAAAVNSQAVLGTATLIAPLYHPIALAEEAATLDIICNGRFVLGLGAGYRDVESRAFGVEPSDRAARLEEMVGVLRRLWTEALVEHAGQQWSFGPVEPHLRPLTPGGPDIWIGAKSRSSVRRAARIGDAWLATSKVPFDELVARAECFQAERASRGLAPAPIPMLRQVVLGRDPEDALNRHLTMSGQRLDVYEQRGLDIAAAGETRDARQTAVLGNPGDIIASIARLAQAMYVGPIITRVAWPGMGRDEAVREIRHLGESVIPALTEIGEAA
jgi:alkanesulfonate monooxygenase SsuD/methylene tetrahydromethanopterin reductase-like flavin-dependent oxidoreductase (luciferase family)